MHFPHKLVNCFPFLQIKETIEEETSSFCLLFFFCDLVSIQKHLYYPVSALHTGSTYKVIYDECSLCCVLWLALKDELQINGVLLISSQSIASLITEDCP